MKSYFAKLAARATLATTPVTSAVAAPKPADPFENTSALDVTPPAARETTPGRSQDDKGLTLQAPAATPLQIETSNPNSARERVADLPMHQSQRPATQSSPADLQTEIKLEPTSLAVNERRPLVESEEDTMDLDPLRLSPPKTDLSPTQLPQRVTDESRDSNDDARATSDRLEEIQQKQSVLMRKADLFMERLFQRQADSVTELENDRDERRDASEPRAQKVESTASLRATAPLPRAPEPVDERPALHIGRLTVEVLPPAPAPPAPPQKIVVVRGQGSNRTALPSSRRFGLSQF